MYFIVHAAFVRIKLMMMMMMMMMMINPISNLTVILIYLN